MSTTHIPSSEQSPSQKAVDFLNKKGKLELWAGTIAAKGLAFGQKQQELNQSAEDAYTRRTLWGEKQDQKTGDEMGGHTILGDIIVPSQPPQQPQQSGLGKLAAAAVVGASLIGIPGAGVAGYLLSKVGQPAAVEKPEPASKDQTLDLGLLRLEDLKQ